MDLAFIVENSFRNLNWDWHKITGFINSIIKRIPIDPCGRVNRVALVENSESEKHSVAFYLDEYIGKSKNDIISRVSSIPHIGTRNSLYSSIELTMDYIFNTTFGDRLDVVNAVVLIIRTTKDDQNPTAQTIQRAINKLHRKAKVVVVIGIGSEEDVPMQMLKTLSVGPEGLDKTRSKRALADTADYFLQVRKIFIQQMHTKSSLFLLSITLLSQGWQGMRQGSDHH